MKIGPRAARRISSSASFETPTNGEASTDDERLVVVAVLEQPEVGEQVDHLLLAEVAAAGRAVRRQTGLAQLLLVPLRVGAGGEEQDDLARARSSAVDELLHPPRDVPRLGAPPVDTGAGVRGLVGHEQLDRGSEHRVGELAGRCERLELLAELGAEEVVDHGEHLGARAVVARQRQQRVGLLRGAPGRPARPRGGSRRSTGTRRRRRTARCRGAGEQIDELALEPIRVLELVDHDRAEAQLLALSQRLVLPQQVARAELEILEVERRLAVLGGRVRPGEAEQKLLQQLAVAQRELVERRLLHRPPRLLVGRRTLAARTEAAEVEQSLGQLRRFGEHERLSRCRTCSIGGAGVLCEAPCRLGELREPRVQAGPLAELERELPAGRAQRLVDGGQHPPQPGGAVGGEQPEPRWIVAGAELVQRRLERLTTDDAPLAVVQHPEARVESGSERVRLQQPEAEAVDGRDPGPVERAGEVVTAELVQPRPDAAAQLPGRALRVRDHEHRLDVETALADRLDEALDEHRRLARAGARRDEDLPARRDRGRLLLVRRPHARLIRHIRQRSHQAGQPSVPFGS